MAFYINDNFDCGRIQNIIKETIKIHPDSEINKHEDIFVSMYQMEPTVGKLSADFIVTVNLKVTREYDEDANRFRTKVLDRCHELFSSG